MTRAFRYTLVGAFALAGVLLYLLATATSNTERYTQNYSLLISLNAAIAAVMFVVVGYLLVRLRMRYRAKEFGTGLTARWPEYDAPGIVRIALISSGGCGLGPPRSDSSWAASPVRRQRVRPGS